MTGISALVTFPLPDSDIAAFNLVDGFKRVARHCGGTTEVTPLGSCVMIQANFPEHIMLPDIFVAMSNRAYKRCERPGEINCYSITLFDHSSGRVLPCSADHLSL